MSIIRDKNYIAVDKSRCPKDHPCPAAKACPAGAFIQYSFDAPDVDPEKCVLCLLCIKKCPKGVFSVKERE